MINFIKNLFKKKETWIFASYVQSSNPTAFAYCHILIKYDIIHKKDRNIIEDIQYAIQEKNNDKNLNIVVLFYDIWKE